MFYVHSMMLVFSALLKYLTIYSFYLYIYLLNLKVLQRLLIFIKYIFNINFIALILCNSALHNSTLSDKNLKVLHLALQAKVSHFSSES